MARYHINAKGEPGVCRAQIQCPFGGEDEHYKSRESARQAYEQQQVIRWHVTTQESLPEIIEKGLTPQIGERSRDLGETKERIYLFRSYDDVVDGVGNWLGEQFDDDEELALLEVRVHPNSVHSDPSTFEDTMVDSIPPDRIRVSGEQL